MQKIASWIQMMKGASRQWIRWLARVIYVLLWGLWWLLTYSMQPTASMSSGKNQTLGLRLILIGCVRALLWNSCIYKLGWTCSLSLAKIHLGISFPIVPKAEFSFTSVDESNTRAQKESCRTESEDHSPSRTQLFRFLGWRALNSWPLQRLVLASQLMQKKRPAQSCNVSPIPESQDPIHDESSSTEINGPCLKEMPESEC